MSRSLDRLVRVCGAVALAFTITLPVANASAEEDLWPLLREQAFGDRPIQEESGMVVLEAPQKVEVAAIVPLTVRVPPHVKGKLKSLSLFIDNNDMYRHQRILARG